MQLGEGALMKDASIFTVRETLLLRVKWIGIEAGGPNTVDGSRFIPGKMSVGCVR
jgi:hypothetical protein